MKKLKIWVSKALAGVMTLMCFVGNSAPLYSQAAESSAPVTINETDNGNDVVHYVALGDSITIGDSYVWKVSDYLKSTYGNCVTSNLAVDGWQSGQLLDALTNPANSCYSYMRYAISNADVITIDIGSNDLLQTTMQVIANCFSCDITQIGPVTAEWSNKFHTLSGWELYMHYLKAMVIARSINYELNSGSVIPAAISQFESNYKSIISVVSQLAPNAKIYIGNLYNPYVKAAVLYVGDYEVLNMERYAEVNLTKMNRIIANNAKGNVIVDLYNTINDPKYIIGDVANYDFNPHPNQDGQAAIAAKFISTMKSGK